MEKVGKKPKLAGKLTTKSKWIILFSIIGLLIVGLVIAIVVILTTRGSSNSDNSGSGAAQTPVVEEGQMNDEELNAAYGEFDQEIAEKMANTGEQYSSEDILKIYAQKIEEVTDKRLKAMIAGDYYTMMMMVNPGDEKKEEIVNGVIEADAVLQTARSALIVANVAANYNDGDLEDKYLDIAYDRMDLTEDVRRVLKEQEKEGTAG